MQIHPKAGVCLLHGFYNPQKGHGSTHFPFGGHRAVQHGILGTSWAHSGWVLGVKILGEWGHPEAVRRQRELHRHGRNHLPGRIPLQEAPGLSAELEP